MVGVTQNYRDLAGEFRQIAQQEDFLTLAEVGATGVAGGVVADQAIERVLPLVGLSSEPTDATGLAVNGLAKWIAAFGLAWAGLQSGRGFLGNVVALSAVGPAVSGGVDMFDAINQTGFFRSGMVSRGANQSFQINQARNGGQATNGSGGRTLQQAAPTHTPEDQQVTAAGQF